MVVAELPWDGVASPRSGDRALGERHAPKRSGRPIAIGK